MKKYLSIIFGIVSIIALVGCSTPSTTAPEKESLNKEEGSKKVVNVYTDRHYNTDAELYDIFTNKTGIEVNVIKAKSDELIERLGREGLDSSADLLITADAARLVRAKSKDLLQEIGDNTFGENIKADLTYDEKFWVPLTVRGRVIVYSKDRVNPEELSTYQNLTDEKWRDRVLVRASSNVYNQSLLASFIELYGEEGAKKWAEGIVKNMARDPEGNDRDQVKAIAAGIGDVAIVNTYYIGKLLNSSDEEEVKAGKSVGVFFPNQETEGTHINISGVGITKSSKNKENALRFIEFLTSIDSQGQFAKTNYEYPVHKEVESSELLKSWGEFKSQNINLSKLGENNTLATRIFDQVGWK